MTSEEIGHLKPSPRSYHWLFVWAVLNALLVVGIVKRGWGHGVGMMIISSALVGGYMFFIDISHKIWWAADQIWWRGWDYLAIKPMRHTVRIGELTEVKAVNHPGNFVPNKPFDRFLLASPADTITILPSFHRREELEELLRLIHDKRPEAFTDPQVLEFMDGGFAEWWRYR